MKQLPEKRETAASHMQRVRVEGIKLQEMRPYCRNSEVQFQQGHVGVRAIMLQWSQAEDVNQSIPTA